MKLAFLRQILLLAGLAFLPAIGQAIYFGERVSWQAPAVAKDEVELALARSWGETVMWVDARPETNYQREHVPQAVLLNEDRWSELLPPVLQAWSPEKRVVVYCSSQGCGASHEVARRLREEAGLPNVFVLHGGWETWVAAKP